MNKIHLVIDFTLSYKYTQPSIPATHGSYTRIRARYLYAMHINTQLQ